MRDNVAWLLLFVMIAYLLFRAFITFVFGPLAGLFFYGHEGAYFLSLLLVAAGSVVLSFLEKRAPAACLAMIVGIVAVYRSVYWMLAVIPRMNGSQGLAMREALLWWVLPEAVFAIAGTCRWAIGRRGNQRFGFDCDSFKE